MSDLDQMYVALLRGVNVGGNNKVPMADLRALAGSLGWQDVRSYIASGNVVFRAGAGDHAGDLHDAMVKQMGVDVSVIVLDSAALRAALAGCPFTPDDLRLVHGFFSAAPVAIDQSVVDTYRAASESIVQQSGVIWLYTPEGFGASKLAGKWTRAVKGDVTGRNLRTIKALVEMLDG
ncbi:MAG: DUF1697 domain-containing protein [Octadecabacter sp.]